MSADLLLSLPGKVTQLLNRITDARARRLDNLVNLDVRTSTLAPASSLTALINKFTTARLNNIDSIPTLKGKGDLPLSTSLNPRQSNGGLLLPRVGSVGIAGGGAGANVCTISANNIISGLILVVPRARWQTRNFTAIIRLGGRDIDHATFVSNTDPGTMSSTDPAYNVCACLIGFGKINSAREHFVPDRVVLDKTLTVTVINNSKNTSNNSPANITVHVEVMWRHI